MFRLHFARVGLLSVLAIVAMVALPVQAVAGKPTILVIPVNDTFFDEFLSDVCGFPIESHVEGTVRIMYTEDPGGPALYREIQVFPGWVKSWTNLDSGKSVSTRGPSVIHVTVNADESTVIEITGLTIGFHEPGKGVTYKDAGHLTIFFDGPEDQEPDVAQTPPAGDFLEALCTQLG